MQEFITIPVLAACCSRLPGRRGSSSCWCWQRNTLWGGAGTRAGGTRFGGWSCWLALPATIPSPVSLFNIFPVSDGAARVVSAEAAPGPEDIQPSVEDAATHPGGAPHWWGGVSPWLGLWAAGALFMAVCLGINHFRLHRNVTRRRPLIDEAVLNLLEDCKQQMGVRTPVTLIETAAVDGPCLFGFLRPRLLLPPGFTRGFSLDELRYVFLHELAHVKRHDILLGWLMAFLQILHWFNPLVWLAFSRMRVDRELACDALALSHAKEQDNQPYGRTIVKLLEQFGNSIRAPSLAGIVEEKQQMKERIIMIAKFHKSNGGFAVAASLLAALGLVNSDGRANHRQCRAAHHFHLPEGRDHGRGSGVERDHGHV